VTRPIRVIVADDLPLFREGVVHSLNSARDVEVVGEASDADDAVRLALERQPDLAILDVHMPGGGLSAAERMRAARPAIRVVTLTVSEAEEDLVAAMKSGAAGYVLKGVSAAELLGVVRSVHAGQVYVPPALAYALLRDMTRPRRPEPLDELTEREREVLGLVAQGLSNYQVGQRLGLAEKTVKHYMTGVMNKLGVRSRVEAALLAVRAGLGETPSGPPGP
jgi:two-component system, NarL family, nitrate/nitrite response regulator NarL